MEVYQDNENIMYNPETVLSHWKTSYHSLLNDSDSDVFDDSFYSSIKEEIQMSGVSDDLTDISELNQPITALEVEQAVMGIEKDKATEIDQTPVEVLQKQHRGLTMISVPCKV